MNLGELINELLAYAETHGERLQVATPLHSDYTLDISLNISKLVYKPGGSEAIHEYASPALRPGQEVGQFLVIG